MFKVLWRAAAVAVAMAVAGVASAATSGTWSLTKYQSADPGLVLKVSKTSGSFSTNLGLGKDYVFSLFKIWTDEADVGNDDKVKKDIRVAFNFTAPSTSGTVTGKTYGIGGIIQKGKAEWDGPLTLSYGSSGSISVRLFDAAFNAGLFGLNDGRKHGAEIKAKITYKSAPAPAHTPLPPAVLLLVGGLGSLGGLAWLRRKRAA